MSKANTCDAGGCTNPTPLDMLQIGFEDNTFCSPDCARSALEEMETAPTEITVLDPQYELDRDDLPGTDETSFYVSIDTLDKARAFIDDIESRHPGEFRPEH